MRTIWHGQQAYGNTDRKMPNTPGVNRGYLISKFGGDLLSQGVYPQVPSALAVLTSVFGMGTGVSLPLWPPKSCVNESR